VRSDSDQINPNEEKNQIHVKSLDLSKIVKDQERTIGTFKVTKSKTAKTKAAATTAKKLLKPSTATAPAGPIKAKAEHRPKTPNKMVTKKPSKLAVSPTTTKEPKRPNLNSLMNRLISE